MKVVSLGVGNRPAGWECFFTASNPVPNVFATPFLGTLKGDTTCDLYWLLGYSETPAYRSATRGSFVSMIRLPWWRGCSSLRNK